jgi:hypothetical protein
VTNHAIRRSKKIVLALLLPLIITHVVVLPIPISPLYFFVVPLSLLELTHIDGARENPKIFVLSVIVFYLINSAACLIFLKRIVRWIVRLTRKVSNRISASLEKIEGFLLHSRSLKKRIIRRWKRIQLWLVFKTRRILLWCMK